MKLPLLFLALFFIPAYGMSFNEKIKKFFTPKPHVHHHKKCNKSFKKLIENGKFDCLLYNLETHQYPGKILNKFLSRRGSTLLDDIVGAYGSHQGNITQVSWPRLLQALLCQKNLNVSFNDVKITDRNQTVKKHYCSSLLILCDHGRYNKKYSFTDPYKNSLELILEVLHILQDYGVLLNKFPECIIEYRNGSRGERDVFDRLQEKYYVDHPRFNEIESLFNECAELLACMSFNYWGDTLCGDYYADEKPSFRSGFEHAIKKMTRFQRLLRNLKGFEDTHYVFQ